MLRRISRTLNLFDVLIFRLKGLSACICLLAGSFGWAEAGQFFISASPEVSGIMRAEGYYKAPLGPDLKGLFRLQRIQIDQSNGREAQFDVIDAELEHRISELWTLHGSFSVLPSTSIPCLRLNRLYLGNCESPDIVITRNGAPVDFMDVNFRNLSIGLTRSLFKKSGHAQIDFSAAHVSNQVSYQSPFLDITNPIILSSALGSGTVQSARDEFLLEQPKRNTSHFGYIEFSYQDTLSIAGVIFQPTIRLANIVYASSSGVWEPHRQVFAAALRIPFGANVREGFSVTMNASNFFDQRLRSIYLNPLTYRDKQEVTGGITLDYAF